MFRHTRGSCSIAMANIGNIIRLINGNPEFHFVAKTVKHEVSIIFEFLNDSLILPAFNILQSLWKVPVVQSDLKVNENQLDIKRFQFHVVTYDAVRKFHIHEVGCLQQAKHPPVCGNSQVQPH